MIAASLTLTSPVARNPVTLRTIKTCPEAVAAWANRNLAGFAKGLGVSPLACDWDLKQTRAEGGGRSN